MEDNNEISLEKEENSQEVVERYTYRQEESVSSENESNSQVYSNINTGKNQGYKSNYNSNYQNVDNAYSGVRNENPSVENVSMPKSVVDEKEKSNHLSTIFIAVCCSIIASLFVCLIGFAIQNNNSSNVEGNLNTMYVSNRGESVDVIDDTGRFTPSEVYKNNVNSVVSIKTEVKASNIFGQTVIGAVAGSGFIITDTGYVITNNHIVENANAIKIIMQDETEYDAVLVGSESENDIAVLKILSEDTFVPVVLGDSDTLTIGEDVVAIGNPLGELAFSLTKGVVSAVNRTIKTSNNTALNMFQVDCAINEGNSGGPVFNMYGEVIGIVSIKYVSEKIEGLGFCIPINDASNIASDIIQYGKVQDKAKMGVMVKDVDSVLIENYNFVSGAYIYSIEEGGSAEKAGLKIGDIIVQVGDQKVSSVSELLLAIRKYRAGETAVFKVWRSGEYIKVNLTFSNIEDTAETDTTKNSNVENDTQTEIQKIPYGNDDFSAFEDYLREYFFGFPGY